MGLMRADLHAKFLAIRDRALAKHAEHLARIRRTPQVTYVDPAGHVRVLSSTPRWKAL